MFCHSSLLISKGISTISVPAPANAAAEAVSRFASACAEKAVSSTALLQPIGGSSRPIHSLELVDQPLISSETAKPLSTTVTTSLPTNDLLLTTLDERAPGLIKSTEFAMNADGSSAASDFASLKPAASRFSIQQATLLSSSTAALLSSTSNIIYPTF
ncbi:unnamed protein product [Protopolystoma xenopodis]|uniref:Uncharacterized protein n=1 Tax=Protopolystoma xenopodis TaxID=117903 RepID=A0A3S5APB0_9PLAT|nr:unnamed protein product [Protopolystoma xenopodis]